MSNHNPIAPPVYFVLMTALYYPAVLGVVFFSMLQTFAALNTDLKTWLLLSCYVAMAISFSVDFLYTYSAKERYPISLFASDNLVLLLLLISYTSLIDALKNDTSATWFLASYSLIHFVFVIWDLWLISREHVSKWILGYDIFGLVLSIVGLLFFRGEPIHALIILWVLTVLYLFVGIKAIVPHIKTA